MAPCAQRKQSSDGGAELGFWKMVRRSEVTEVL
jgi:hypothetical protein